MKPLAELIGTVGYVGHIRPAPGTWGSLAAFPIGYIIYLLGGFWLFALAIPVAYFKGLWATKIYTSQGDDHDPSEIVIDEVVGQWIAILPAIYVAHIAGAHPVSMWPILLIGFAAFRLFDITKPSLVGWADARGDATGVMLDDVIAGLFAASVVAFAISTLQWWTGL